MRRAFLAPINALIWCVNQLDYFAHLEGQRHCEKYTPYDFSQAIKYLR